MIDKAIEAVQALKARLDSEFGVPEGDDDFDSSHIEARDTFIEEMDSEPYGRYQGMDDAYERVLVALRELDKQEA